jgi:hypothetical protein
VVYTAPSPAGTAMALMVGPEIGFAGVRPTVVTFHSDELDVTNMCPSGLTR